MVELEVVAVEIEDKLAAQRPGSLVVSCMVYKPYWGVVVGCEKEGEEWVWKSDHKETLGGSY